MHIYCSVVTQGKNESGLLTILAAVPVMHLFCACIGRHTVLHKISVPEHYVFVEALCLIWLYVVGQGAVWIPVGCCYAVILRYSCLEMFGYSGK